MICVSFKGQNILIQGKPNKEWELKFQELLFRTEELWDIQITKALADLSWNFVAETNKGTIIKIGPNKDEINSEAKCLAAFHGNFCCKMIDHNEDIGALHIEKLSSTLTSNEDLTEYDQSVICAELIHNLPKEFENLSEFKSVGSWLKRISTKSNIGNIEKSVIDKAQYIATELMQDNSTPAVLLHGDLHHGNIMRKASGIWSCIDPKGVVGDRVYEVGAFIRNPIPRIYKLDNLRSIIDSRICIFEEIIGYDRKKMQAWSFVQSVLSYLWFLDDDEKSENVAGMEKVALTLNQVYK